MRKQKFKKNTKQGTLKKIHHGVDLVKTLVPVFLCLFLLGGCTPPPPSPEFEFTAFMETEDEDFSCEIFSSEFEPIEVKTVTPEVISGMTAKAGNSLVSVNFGGTVKSSDKFPEIKDFSCSRAALILDSLRRAELQLMAEEEGRFAYKAETELGELTLVTDNKGHILAFRQENSGFTLRLCHQDKENSEP